MEREENRRKEAGDQADAFWGQQGKGGSRQEPPDSDRESVWTGEEGLTEQEVQEQGKRKEKQGKPTEKQGKPKEKRGKPKKTI